METEEQIKRRRRTEAYCSDCFMYRGQHRAVCTHRETGRRLRAQIFDGVVQDLR